MAVPASNPPHTACAEWHHQLWVICATTYQISTAGLAGLAKSAAIYKAARFSDHAPLSIDYDFEL